MPSVVHTGLVSSKNVEKLAGWVLSISVVAIVIAAGEFLSELTVCMGLDGMVVFILTVLLMAPVRWALLYGY